MEDVKLYYIVFLAACHVTALLVFGIVILRLIYLMFRRKNVNRTERLIAIAITFLFFSTTLQQAVLSPTQVLITNTQQLFHAAYEEVSSNTNQQSTGESNTKDAPVSTEHFGSIDQVISAFPLARLIMAVAFCILVYYIIMYFKRFVTSATSQTPVSANKTVFIYNLLISLVLLFSLFLVFSVCITIPYFNQLSKPTTFTVARLDSTLNGYSKKDSFDLSVPLDSTLFADGPIRRIIFSDSTTVQQFNKLNSNEQSKINNSINEFERQISYYKSKRNNLIKEIKDYNSNYKANEDKYKKELSINFEKVTQSLTTDKAEIFQASVHLFTDFVQSVKTGFDNTVNSLSQSDLFNRSEKQNAIDKIKDAINEYAKSSKRDSSYNPYAGYYSISPNFIDYSNFLVENTGSHYVPTYIKNGSDWGIFGWLAEYLITTQSSELVLLMGMFGFGLLGASLLSFRKKEDSSNFLDSFQSTLLIPNFENVLARGFGAALVIYLATKGGLAIFSAGTNTDANGYILLLTCFVGAVFSETVWQRIRKALYGNDGKDGGENGDKNKEGNDQDVKVRVIPNYDATKKQAANNNVDSKDSVGDNNVADKNNAGDNDVKTKEMHNPASDNNTSKNQMGN